MTFSAILLPRVEKAGGEHPSRLAAGRPIVVRGREARKRGTLVASRPMRQRQPHSEHAERDACRAIFGHDPSFGVRRDVRIGAGIRNALRLPVHVTPTLNFSRALKAPGGLILSGNARVHRFQQSACGLPQRFHCSFVSVALVHDENHSNGAAQCPTKEFPISEREFPRVI